MAITLERKAEIDAMMDEICGPGPLLSLKRSSSKTRSFAMLM